VFAGRSQANGYTEAILYRWRRAFKAEHCSLLQQAEPEAIIGAIA
jgi:hypothetical protein